MGRTEETGVNIVGIVKVAFKGHTGPYALPVFRNHISRGALPKIPARLTYD